LQFGADFASPSTHISQTMPELTGSRRGVKSGSVVSDLQPGTLSNLAKRHSNTGCLSMTQTIAHGFLGNMQQLSRLSGREGIGANSIDFNLKRG
jgi:hypothetical protein